jgi:hypothetical protein
MLLTLCRFAASIINGLNTKPGTPILLVAVVLAFLNWDRFAALLIRRLTRAPIR